MLRYPAFIYIQRTYPCQFSYPFLHTKKDTFQNLPASLLYFFNITLILAPSGFAALPFSRFALK